MWWAIVKCVQITVVGIGIVFLYTTNVNAWTVGVPPEYILSEVKSYSTTFCSGSWGDITVTAQGTINACVMGSGVKIASYYPIQGQVSYAISYPLDTKYYPLDVCTGLWGCVYSEATDTFMGFSWVNMQEVRGVVYKQFTKNLQQKVESGVTHYQLNNQVETFSPQLPDSSTFYGQTAAISRNGKWGMLEVRNYGFYRINLETNEIRRVIAPGFTYTNYGPQPGTQMTISNDGKTVTVMGLRLGVWVVEVDATCGDMLSWGIQHVFSGAVTACPFLSTPTHQYSSNFTHAVSPEFSFDSSSLSFNIFGNGVQPVRVTLLSDSKQHSLSHYLAIGDSFTSGEGEVDDAFYLGGATNRCHVSSRSYPYLLGMSLHYPTFNAACSGATMDTARGNQLKNDQISQIQEVESRLPRVLTIGIGGNDAGLMGKLKTCIGLDTCEWAKSVDERQNTAEEIKNLYPKLRIFYEDVKAKIPGKVVVIGYPKIISSEPICLNVVAPLLNQTERIFMNEAIHYLNEVIEAAANDGGVDFINVENVFQGSELCTLASSPSMNEIRFGGEYPALASLPDIKVIAAESFHPTPQGHEQLSTYILQHFTSVFSSQQCVTCSEVRGVPTASLYWSGNDSVGKHQQAFAFLNKVTVKKGDEFEISLPAFSFQPHSEVIVELHSDVQKIATLDSGDDGSLQAALTVGDFLPGHHSVNVIGSNPSGERIEVYDFLNIEGENVIAQQQVQPPIDKSEKSIIKRSMENFISPPISEDKVLGVSVASLPVVSPPSSSEKDVSPPNELARNVTYPYLLPLIGSVAGLFIGALIVYLFFRQKAS